MKHACKDAQETSYANAEISLQLIDEDLIESAIEDILDQIFGTSSKMTRNLFLQKLESDECKWIMDAEEIRKKMKRYVLARQRGISVFDQMGRDPAEDPTCSA